MKVLIDDLSHEELKGLISDAVREAIQVLIPEKQAENEFLTRKQVAFIFKISLPTLNIWTKEGKLQSYRINSRVRYKKAEIESALKEVPNMKYKRS